MALCEVCAETASFLIKLKRTKAEGGDEECTAAFCCNPCKAFGMEERERAGWQRVDPPVMPPP